MAVEVRQAGAPLGEARWCPSDDTRARWLTRVREAIMLDIVDPPVLAQKAAVALHEAVGMSFTGVAIRGAEGLFAMHGVAGGRHDEVLRRIRVSSGQGLGGKVVSLRRPVTVTDYVHDPAITTHFRDLAVMEELGGMTAVPVLSESEVVAILYSATRNVGSLGDRAVATLDTAAASLGDLFGVAVRHGDAVRQQAAAERQRIAEDLHDSLGHVLFAIGASARTLRPGAIITTDVAESAYVAQALSLVGKRGRVVATAIAHPTDTTVDMSLFELTLYEKQLRGCVFGSANPHTDIPTSCPSTAPGCSSSTSSSPGPIRSTTSTRATRTSSPASTSAA